MLMHIGDPRVVKSSEGDADVGNVVEVVDVEKLFEDDPVPEMNVEAMRYLERRDELGFKRGCWEGVPLNLCYPSPEEYAREVSRRSGAFAKALSVF